MRAVSGWIVGNYMQCTRGSSASTQGTAVPQESEAQTEQHMLGHRFPAWNKSTGLSFISNVCDLHERTTVTQPQQCVVYRSLIDSVSYFHMSLRPSLPPCTTWWWLQNSSREHVAGLAAVWAWLLCVNACIYIYIYSMSYGWEFFVWYNVGNLKCSMNN